VATLTIRDLDDDLKSRLRIRAAEHGRSMEAEVREILRATLDEPRGQRGLATRIRRRLAGEGFDVELPPRTDMPRVVEFDE
jgi:plasmid stability protein